MAGFSSMFCLLIITFYPLVSLLRVQSIFTIPDTSEEDECITVDPGINLTVVCTVFSSETNQIQTLWRIRKPEKGSELRKINFAQDGLPTEAGFKGHFIATGKQIPMTQNTYRTNLTFSTSPANFILLNFNVET